MRVLVTGATGLVGRQLGILLVQRGHKVYVLSRSKEKAKLVCPFPCEVLEGDLAASKFPSLSEIELDAVINLAGESVVGARWSEESKKEISRSRVDFTKNLVGSLKNIKKFISASAIGFYGEGGENDLTVSSPSDGSFLSEVCRQWEEEAFQARHLGAKVSCLRIGIVLSREGGALEKMLFPFKAGVGGALGSGQQWMSWIHIRDLVRLLVHTLENDAPPVINAVAPNPVRNLDFSRALAKVLGRWLGPSVPRMALRIALGEAERIITASQKVIVGDIPGFTFLYPELSAALADLLQDAQGLNEVLEFQQYLPLPLEEVFSFFKNPHNLEAITPANLNFHILRISTPDIREGTLIDYRLKIRGFPVHWQTQIEEWQPPYRFVDTQLKGPYSLWHHTHSFEPLGEGVLMTDRVKFRLPLHWPGWIAAQGFVKNDVRKIFTYRRTKIPELLKF